MNLVFQIDTDLYNIIIKRFFKITFTQKLTFFQFGDQKNGVMEKGFPD